MTDLRKAAEMALEALEMHVLGFDGVRKMELAIEALESALAKPDETETLKRCLFQMQEAAKALAQPEQEPVAWASTNDQVCALLRQAHDVLAIASFPPKREWQGLTDEELNNISEYGNTDWTKRKSLARAIQAKLREKNT